MTSTYDYVIVGAGSAGCVVARRLTDAGARVLLLEAGGKDGRMEVRIPAAFSKLFKTEADWAYEAEAEDAVAGRRLFLPRGKLLGGCSSMNAMLYIRGNPRDYDGWAAAGCEGWGWEAVRPYFLKSEDNSRGASEHHGAGGPLRVEDPRDPRPLPEMFLAAAEACGLPRNGDFNGARQEGVGYFQVTQRRGRRWSTADGFLRPVLRRPNLTVRTGAAVRRVVFEGRRAVGVEFANGSGTETVSAGEVILSGGAFASPQLLLLSGIGSAAQLEEHGIPIVHALPGVGENLQDHPFLPLNWRSKRPVSLADAESLGSLARYLLTRRGPLTSTIAEAGGFVHSTEGLEAPDLQFHFASNFYVDHGFANPEGHGLGLAPTLITPESRGRLRLAGADPSLSPRIGTGTFTAAADVERMARGVELAHRILHHAAFDEVRGEPHLPAPQGEAALRDYIRQRTDLIYHPVGTCKMGIDPAAVVDPALRVHGIEGLRVIDASVMPTIPRGNTNAPTVMIAEKGADLLLR